MNGRVDRHVLVEYNRKLENIISRKDSQTSTQVIDILNILQNLQIDPLLIRNAKIILTINNLRRTLEDRHVIDLSKKLLISWKNAVMAENTEIRDFLMNGWTERTENVGRKLKYKDQLRMIITRGTNDENRIKSREFLSKALMSENSPNEDLLKIAKIGVEIENFIFLEFKNTDNKYKTRIRSRISNLGDDNNPKLREQVLKGRISPEEVAKMSSEELASDRMKQLRSRFSKEALSENILPEVYGTTSDLLKCPECKKNTCSYNQVQIERADEPMTTFCLCISCGHRWRF